MTITEISPSKDEQRLMTLTGRPLGPLSPGEPFSPLLLHQALEAKGRYQLRGSDRWQNRKAWGPDREPRYAGQRTDSRL